MNPHVNGKFVFSLRTEFESHGADGALPSFREELFFIGMTPEPVVPLEVELVEYLGTEGTPKGPDATEAKDRFLQFELESGKPSGGIVTGLCTSTSAH
jgi:hypothetical protein